jgi:hypothetical protein
VINPHPPARRSRVLSEDAHFFKQVRKSALADSQLPPMLSDEAGTITKPARW